MAPKRGTRVVAYFRVSTEKQGQDGESLADQRVRLEAYAVAKGLQLVAVLSDVRSGGSTNGRKGLQQALGMLDRGEAEGLLVTSLSRLTRSIRDLERMLTTYFTEGATVPRALICLDDPIDTRTAAGRMVTRMLMSVFEWERDMASERTTKVMRHLRKQGVQVGRAPFGYRWSAEDDVDQHGRRYLVPDDREQAVIARMRQLQADGLTLARVADQLNADGLRPRSPNSDAPSRWHASSISAVLRRIAAKG